MLSVSLADAHQSKATQFLPMRLLRTLIRTNHEEVITDPVARAKGLGLLFDFANSESATISTKPEIQETNPPSLPEEFLNELPQRTPSADVPFTTTPSPLPPKSKSPNPSASAVVTPLPVRSPSDPTATPTGKRRLRSPTVTPSVMIVSVVLSPGPSKVVKPESADEFSKTPKLSVSPSILPTVTPIPSVSPKASSSFKNRNKSAKGKGKRSPSASPVHGNGENNINTDDIVFIIVPTDQPHNEVLPTPTASPSNISTKPSVRKSPKPSTEPSPSATNLDSDDVVVIITPTDENKKRPSPSLSPNPSASAPTPKKVKKSTSPSPSASASASQIAAQSPSQSFVPFPSASSSISVDASEFSEASPSPSDPVENTVPPERKAPKPSASIGVLTPSPSVYAQEASAFPSASIAPSTSSSASQQPGENTSPASPSASLPAQVVEMIPSPSTVSSELSATPSASVETFSPSPSASEVLSASPSVIEDNFDPDASPEDTLVLPPFVGGQSGEQETSPSPANNDAPIIVSNQGEISFIPSPSAVTPFRSSPSPVIDILPPVGGVPVISLMPTPTASVFPSPVPSITASISPIASPTPLISQSVVPLPLGMSPAASQKPNAVTDTDTVILPSSFSPIPEVNSTDFPPKPDVIPVPDTNDTGIVQGGGLPNTTLADEEGTLPTIIADGPWKNLMGTGPAGRAFPIIMGIFGALLVLLLLICLFFAIFRGGDATYSSNTQFSAARPSDYGSTQGGMYTEGGGTGGSTGAYGPEGAQSGYEGTGNYGGGYAGEGGGNYSSSVRTGDPSLSYETPAAGSLGGNEGTSFTVGEQYEDSPTADHAHGAMAGYEDEQDSQEYPYNHPYGQAYDNQEPPAMDHQRYSIRQAERNVDYEEETYTLPYEEDTDAGVTAGLPDFGKGPTELVSQYEEYGEGVSYGTYGESGEHNAYGGEESAHDTNQDYPQTATSYADQEGTYQQDIADINNTPGYDPYTSDDNIAEDKYTRSRSVHFADQRNSVRYVKNPIRQFSATHDETLDETLDEVLDRVMDEETMDEAEMDESMDETADEMTLDDTMDKTMDITVDRALPALAEEAAYASAGSDPAPSPYEIGAGANVTYESSGNGIGSNEVSSFIEPERGDELHEQVDYNDRLESHHQNENGQNDQHRAFSPLGMSYGTQSTDGPWPAWWRGDKKTGILLQPNDHGSEENISLDSKTNNGQPISEMATPLRGNRTPSLRESNNGSEGSNPKKTPPFGAKHIIDDAGWQRNSGQENLETLQGEENRQPNPAFEYLRKLREPYVKSVAGRLSIGHLSSSPATASPQDDKRRSHGKQIDDDEDQKFIQRAPHDGNIFRSAPDAWIRTGSVS